MENNEVTAQNKQDVPVLVQASKFHSGPLPTPEDFAKYELTLKGSAERMLTMAENELKSIQEMREKEFIIQKRGMYMGFISLVLVLALIFYAMYSNQPWVAGVLIAAISGCGIFVTVLNKKNQ